MHCRRGSLGDRARGDPSDVTTPSCGPGRAVKIPGDGRNASGMGEKAETSAVAGSSRKASSPAAATSWPAPACAATSCIASAAASEPRTSKPPSTGHETSSPWTEPEHPVARGPSRECTGARCVPSDGADPSQFVGVGEKAEGDRRWCRRRWSSSSAGGG